MTTTLLDACVVVGGRQRETYRQRLGDSREPRLDKRERVVVSITCGYEMERMTRSPRPNYDRVNGIHDTSGPYDYGRLGPYSGRQKDLNSNS